MSIIYDIVRRDPEARWGLRPKAYTGVGRGLSLSYAVIWTGIFYGVLSLLRLIFLNKVYLEMFFPGGPAQRSWIPVLTVFLGMWCLAILWIKHRKTVIQRRALAGITAAGFPENFARPEDFAAAAMAAKLHSLQSQDLSPAEVMTLFDSAFADLERYFESTFTEIRALIWAAPVLGFIGTVLGLTKAVGGFGALSTSSEALQQALPQVTGGLGTAFETTLIALVIALGLQILTTFQFKAEEDLLLQIKKSVLEK